MDKVRLSDIISVKDILVLEDNQSCIKSISNQGTNSRLKHIDIKIKQLRQTIKDNGIQISYVPSSEQIADIMTKILPAPRQKSMCKSIGLMYRDGVVLK